MNSRFNLFSRKIFLLLPVILLYTLVFTGFDLSFFVNNYNFSFNFVYLVIFFWSLKNPNYLGYGYIFFAGIINDVVQNFPIGVSSINYLFLSLIAAFIRVRLINPSIFYDWVLFLVSILIVSSINYIILSMIFIIPIKYGTLMTSSLITFMVYPIFSKIFTNINLINIKYENKQQI